MHGPIVNRAGKGRSDCVGQQVEWLHTNPPGRKREQIMQPIDTGRREYPLSGSMRGFLIVFGTIFEGFSVFLVYISLTKPNSESLLYLTIVPILMGIYLLASALRSRLVIDGTHLEVRGAFTEKTADLNEIEGFRTISSRNGSYWQLQRKDGRGTITLQKSYDCDGVRAWLQQMPDLDERDRKALLEQIEQSQELGATPEERLAALNKAKQLNYGFMAVAIAAALGFGLGSTSVHLPSAIVLALLPPVLVYLVRSQPLLYAVFKPKRDPRTDLGIAFVACGLGLIYGNSSLQFVERFSLLEYAGLVGGLFCAGIYSAARKNPQFWGAMISMLFIAGAYGYGLAAAADTVADRSTPASYTATVEGKHESHGRSTTYYLDLGPWGPMQGANSLSVSSSTYDTSSTGEQVCLELHPGVLHVQWYQMVACAGMEQ